MVSASTFRQMALPPKRAHTASRQLFETTLVSRNALLKQALWQLLVPQWHEKCLQLAEAGAGKPVLLFCADEVTLSRISGERG